jgi:hypothetical protein
VDVALRAGTRGLRRGGSLPRLLAEHRGRLNRNALPRLTHDQILAWADAHHAAHGRWPKEGSGAVNGAPGQKWKAVDMALRQGSRGLPQGSSLARLLAEHRGCRNKGALPRLTRDQILVWADAYHAAHDRWPTRQSGLVSGAQGETWCQIDHALKSGNRGLREATTLARLLRGRAAPVRR